MRIDAHLHFWRPACNFDNRPIADNAFYRRDFLPADVIPDPVSYTHLTLPTNREV